MSHPAYHIAVQEEPVKLGGCLDDTARHEM
jgi:hypothetical protein